MSYQRSHLLPITSKERSSDLKASHLSRLVRQRRVIIYAQQGQLGVHLICKMHIIFLNKFQVAIKLCGLQKSGKYALGKKCITQKDNTTP